MEFRGDLELNYDISGGGRYGISIMLIFVPTRYSYIFFKHRFLCAEMQPALYQ